MTLIVLLVIAILLFGMAFVTKRRFGVLGLGLTAGLVLSQYGTKGMAAFLQNIDMPVEPLTYVAAATLFLTIAPALVLLVAGPKYSDKRLAIVSSLAFAAFGATLLLVPIVTSIPSTDPSSMRFFSSVAQNMPTIVIAGVIAAVVDMMNAHSKKPFGKKDKH